MHAILSFSNGPTKEYMLTSALPVNVLEKVWVSQQAYIHVAKKVGNITSGRFIILVYCDTSIYAQGRALRRSYKQSEVLCQQQTEVLEGAVTAPLIGLRNALEPLRNPIFALVDCLCNIPNQNSLCIKYY